MCASFGELTVPVTLSLFFSFVSPETLPFVIAVLFVLAMCSYTSIKLSTGVTWRQWMRVNRVERV